MTNRAGAGRAGTNWGGTNWAGNVVFGARRLHRPSSVDELCELVAAAGRQRDRVRALGTAHSFSRIADTTGDLVSVAGLPPVVDLHPAGPSDASDASGPSDTTGPGGTAGPSVTVAAGLRYGELVGRLHDAGHALPNLGSLPHISVAGACATGTHGSGDRNGCLATAVSALELVTASGELVRLRRGDDGFDGAVVGLGALGVVTSMTLDLVPAFDVRQYVYEGLPLAAVAEHHDEIFAAGYSVSLFTRWAGPVVDQVWLKRPAGDPAPPRSWLGAALADGPRHPVPGMSAATCTAQLGEPGPWHARLPHFRLEFTPSSGDELQSEYLVPRAAAVDALAAVDAIRDRVAPVLQISELRTVAADNLWLSPAYGRDSLAVHFTWIRDTDAVLPVVAAVEERLALFAARPHWGKVFGTDPGVVAGLYERAADFRRLLHRYDPAGTFRNELIDRYFPVG